MTYMGETTNLIELTDFDIDTPAKKAALARILSPKQLRDAFAQVSKRRTVPPKANEGIEHVPEMTDLEYEKWRTYRQKILDESGYEPDPKKPVSFVIDTRQIGRSGHSGMKEFEQLFGAQKLLEAMGAGDLVEFSDEAMHRALDIPFEPYTTSSEMAEHVSKRKAPKKLESPFIDRTRK